MNSDKYDARNYDFVEDDKKIFTRCDVCIKGYTNKLWI